MRKSAFTNSARIKILPIVLIISLGFVVYFNSLSGKFIWDDEFLVKDNVYIKSWCNIKKIFTKDIGAGSDKQYYSYRPIQMFAYALDYSLWRLNPKGYHLTNIILHILAALAVYQLISMLYADRNISCITALLFLVNPLHTEAVTYISGRADSLAALFLLLSFIFYVKLIRRNSIKNRFIVLLTYLLALLSKEYALILPLLLASYHYVFGEKLNLKRFSPILAITFLYILMRLTFLSSLMPPKALISTSLFQRFPGVFAALTNYIKLLFLPFNLHMEYGNKIFSPADPGVIAGAMIFILLLTLALLKRKENSKVSFAIFWFFITLFPQSNILPVNAYMAEHWLYLPSMGFFLILAEGSNHLYKIRNLRAITITFLAAILTFYSLLTVRQNSRWKEPISFYERTLKYAPYSSRVFYNLGSVYRESGKLAKARDAYKKAIEIDPDYAQAYNSLGVVTEKNEEAIACYKKAIEINPKYAKAYNNLANIYKKMGENQEALALYKKAIEITPDYADAYFNLGNTYESMDNKVEAIASFKKAIEINQSYTEAYKNLADIYEEMGKPDEAVKTYRQAIKVNPGYADAYNNLGIILYTLIGEKDEAMAAFEKSVKINPDLADAHNNLAIVYYYHKKEYDLAVKHCDKAIELGHEVNPEFLRLLKPFRK